MVDDTVDGCEILHHQFGMVESPWGPSTFKGLLVQPPIFHSEIHLQDTAHLIPGSLDAPGMI